MQARTLLLGTLLGAYMGGCSTNNDMTTSALPSRYEHLEFWNGGSKIFEGNGCTMKIIVSSKFNLMPQSTDTNFYIYYPSCRDNSAAIIDSEALAILWRE